MEQKEIIDIKDYKDFGTWHTNLPFITIGNTRLIVKGMITGCGIAQLHGVANLSANINPDEFREKFQDIRDNGVGAVICTLGQSYYASEDKLLNLGFEKLSEYSNYRHGQDGNYKQRLYIYKL
jgi:hypothetical protein